MELATHFTKRFVTEWSLEWIGTGRKAKILDMEGRKEMITIIHAEYNIPGRIEDDFLLKEEDYIRLLTN